MKSIPQEIVGKRVETVMIRESEDDKPPAAQLFLCFDDGTSVEFWADGVIHPAGGIDNDTAEDIERKARSGSGTRARTNPPQGQDNESICLTSALNHIQDLIGQVLDSLSEDLTGEARRGIGTIEQAANNSGIPDGVRAPLLDGCEQATKAISGVTRNNGACSRILRKERERIAEEVKQRGGA